MKEIMLPYVLIIWMLVKLGVIEWNLKNAVRSVGFGVFLAFALFTGHRFWSPADLTDSSTVKAPHAVLSPLIGQEVEEIFVVHNQFVKKGDLIYTLVSVDSTEQIRALNAQKDAVSAQRDAGLEQIRALEVSINNDKRNLDRLTKLNDFASQQDKDDLEAKIDANTAQIAANRAQLMAQEAQMQSYDAQIESAKWQDKRREIRAQFDGQVGITNITEGTRVGNMHLYDTSKKFLEMRIADQAYRYIKWVNLRSFM